MINDVKIGAYRGLKELEIKELKNINVFVGPNNCGKTSILEAIILSVLFEKTEPLMDILLSRYHDFSPELFVALFPERQESVIDLWSRIDHEEKMLHTCLTYKKIGQVIANKDEIEIHDAYELKFDYSMNSEDHDYFRLRIVTENDEYIINWEKSKENKLDMRMNVPCRFISFSRFDRSGQFLKTLDELLNKNLRQELLEILQIFDAQIENFEIVGSKRVIKLFRKGEKTPLTLYDYGNGMYKAFYIAISALMAKDGILLVDEVEAGIHNKALECFIQKLIVVCEKNNVQLFFTTHSLEAIDILLNDCKDKLNDVAFYHVRNSQNKSVAKRYDGEKLLSLRNEIGFDIR